MTTEPTTLLVDSHHGIYAGQVLAQSYELSGIDAESIAILEAGPEHEDYDWVCAEELHYATVVAKDGKAWQVDWREGDIIAVHPDAEWSEYLDGYVIRQPDTVEYTIPEWALSYLVNGDASGLGGMDKVTLEAFLASDDGKPFNLGTWSIMSEPYFSHTNDVGGLACDVVDVWAC